MTRRLFFALLATLTGLFANVALPKPRRQQWPMGSPNPLCPICDHMAATGQPVHRAWEYRRARGFWRGCEGAVELVKPEETPDTIYDTGLGMGKAILAWRDPVKYPDLRIFGVVGLQCGPLTLWPPPKNFAVLPAAPTEMLDSSRAVERYRRCANNEIWR